MSRDFGSHLWPSVAAATSDRSSLPQYVRRQTLDAVRSGANYTELPSTPEASEAAWLHGCAQICAAPPALQVVQCVVARRLLDGVGFTPDERYSGAVTRRWYSATVSAHLSRPAHRSMRKLPEDHRQHQQLAGGTGDCPVQRMRVWGRMALRSASGRSGLPTNRSGQPPDRRRQPFGRERRKLQA